MAIITISRGSLSGGRIVAECLAEHLGYPCVAHEVLRGAARRLGLAEDVVREKFETPPRLWSRLSRDREVYLLAVKTALADKCLDGCLVYHGPAGQFFLAGVPCVLSVRLIAPLQQRVRALTGPHHRLTRKAALEFIENVDEERRRWARLMFGADVEDPSLYDLTVNQRFLSVETACVAVAEAAGQPEFQVTDEALSELTSFAASCHDRLDALLDGEE